MSDKTVPKMLSPLTAKDLKTVRAELARGGKVSDVVDLIQKTWGKLPKVKRGSLAKCLTRYRDAHVSEVEILEAVQADTAKIIEASVAKLDEHINALDGFQELIQLQMKRVRKATLLEQDNDTLYKQTGVDIDVANRLLAGYVTTAVKAGVISHMIPEPEVAPTVVTNEFSSTVLHRPDLKQGLMQVIGSVLQDVQDLPDDIHAAS